LENQIYSELGPAQHYINRPEFKLTVPDAHLPGLDRCHQTTPTNPRPTWARTYPHAWASKGDHSHFASSMRSRPPSPCFTRSRSTAYSLSAASIQVHRHHPSQPRAPPSHPSTLLTSLTVNRWPTPLHEPPRRQFSSFVSLRH
jgi:hypothetical protein